MEYTPNSHRFKEEQQNNAPTERKIEKVVRGSTKLRKKSEIRKVADVFISEDAQNVKSYIVMDVLIPAVKKLISDIVVNGIDMIMYGSTGHSNRKSNTDKVSYRNYYDDRRGSNRGSETRSRYEFDEIEFESRGEAEAVLQEMDNVMERYGMVRVADMYDMAGRQAPYTSNNFGWTSLRNAEVRRLRNGGYVINLPRAMALD